MSEVRDQYEAYPYPERDPADEAKRLITGSPSDPREVDHVLFGGQRDWTQPIRALFAGGGTGDGLIQFAQLLTSAGRPYEITYIDLSKAARAVAEARAKARGLTGITFITGSLLDAPDHGPFDYIDCCGVLHHLPDPAAGFAALRAAVAADGGLGFMVYAPHGRSGVYPLQEAFGTMLAGLPPQERLARGKEIFAKLPDGHPFKRNTQVGDHKQSDAGFYDLLLHTQDRSFDVAALLDVMEATGWALAGFCEPLAYDPGRFGPVPEDLDGRGRMALAEKLCGTMKVHVGYARPIGAAPQRGGLDRIPHLRGGAAQQVARAVAAGKTLPLNRADGTIRLHLPKAAAQIIARVDGRRSLATLARGAGLDPIAFQSLWAQVERPLAGWGMLHYSNLLKGR